MKQDQILEGNWVVKSIDGVEKRFPRNKEAEARAWEKTTARPPMAPAAPRQQAPKVDLHTVWRKVEQVVSNIYPDGDPIDWLGPWVKQQGLDYSVIDKAAKANGYDDLYDYWDSMAQMYSRDQGLSEATEMPEVGDTIRTQKMQMEGKVEKIEPYNGFTVVYFRIQDGRLMKTPVENVIVIQKLQDENMNINKANEGYSVVPNIDTNRYQSRNGLEGPFRAKNGKVVYYDPQEGKYYDPDSDFYISYDEWADMNEGLTFSHEMQQESSMGGINPSSPAQDVSYEKILDEVLNKWKAEQINELSIDTMQQYRKSATLPSTVQTRPLRKLARSVVGFKQAGDKIAARTGDRSGNRPKTGPINSRHSTIYEERLSEFIDLDENDFSNILQKQHTANNDAKKKPIKDIPFHGWTIRYRPASAPGKKVSWLVLDKNHQEKHRGESMSDKDAVADAEEWIKLGGGTKQEANSNVIIDFNVDFAREFATGGETLYIMFDKQGNTPMIYVSTEPQNGFKRTYPRNQKHKMTATTTALPMVSLSAKESNSLGLRPNGRYLLGDKDPIDDNTAAFPLIFQGVVQGKGDMIKMGKPGLTVAHNRDVAEGYRDGHEQQGMMTKGGREVPNCIPQLDEVYLGPWQGDPEKYAKAPKSTTMGSVQSPLASMIKDTIKTHGVKWAFNYYVKKHGMPPMHFKIYSGI